MPICFGIKEFAIITGLRCHHAVQPLPIVKPKNTTNKTKKVKGKEKIADDDDLVDIVGKSYRSTNLLTDLESKTLSSKHKESLRLVWFVHAILWAKDTKQVIPTSLLKLSQDREEFNNYPWGHESYNLTVKYLLQKLGHLKPFRTSDSKSRTTLKRFLIQGSLDGCLPRTTKKRMLSTCSPLLMMQLCIRGSSLLISNQPCQHLLTLGFVRTLPDRLLIGLKENWMELRPSKGKH